MILTNRHALITGGGTGIGLAIARTLAAQGAPSNNHRPAARYFASVATDQIHALAMDVTDEAQQIEAIAQLVRERGAINICVANAGIAEGRSLQKTTMEFWRQIMAANLDGAFITIRELLRSMLESDWGRVIAISSIAGVRGLKGGAYSASKHGVIGLIRSYSEEYMGGHVTFNAICPGYVDTPIIDHNLEVIQKRGFSREDAMNMMVSANPHKQLIPPQDIAEAALWLCSPTQEV